MRKISILAAYAVFLISLAWAPFRAFAGIPKLMTYNGVLKNSSGSFLNGSYSMKFRIYNAATGGTALWTETQTVTVSSGRFSAQLGSVTALSLDFSQDYWLSVQVGTDAEMTPRQRLTAAGYAYMAEKVVNGFTQASHDALSHKNIEGVKDNTANIAKTNFKLDAYTFAAANSMGDMILDTFNDSTGIAAAQSSGYTWRPGPDYDVTTTPGGIDTNAVLALHMNGVNGATTFTDSSSSAKAMTRSGNPTISTVQSKFGGSSGLFGAADYLTAADSADWDFGTGDFTIDFWIRWQGSVVSTRVFDIGSGIYNNQGVGAIANGAKWEIYIMGGVSQFAWAPAADTWYHIAIVRSGTDLMMFANGVQIDTVKSNSSNINAGAYGLSINRNYSQTGGGITGWIEEFRISKGKARWTAAFTPPAQEYSANAGSATVVSQNFTEPVPPAEAMVISDESLNGGTITYYVSRDGGTTWTLAPRETVVSLDTQPSGTQLRWKVVITGSAELNGIAVAV